MALLLSFSLVLVFLFSAVSGQLQDYQTVECYRSSSNCNSQTNGVSVRAIDCCNRTGGGYIRHTSLQNQCGACIVVGFDKSVIHFGPEDRNKRIDISAQILLTTPGAPSISRSFRFNIRQLPDPLPDNIGDFLPSLPGGRDSSRLPYTYNVQYASYGNGKALESSVTVTYDIAATGEPRGAIPSGAVMVYRNVNITADDIDTISVDVDTCFLSPNLEGSIAMIKISYKRIPFVVPFKVIITFEKYYGPLWPDEGAAGDDDFNFNLRTYSVVFKPTEVIKQIQFKYVVLMIPSDNIVELTEYLMMRISVNDSRVRVNGGPLRTLMIHDQNAFTIGFKDLDITIREGEIATLIVQQTNDHRGGTSIGGFPELLMEQLRMRELSGNATEPGEYGADYSLNDTIPLFKYTSSNTLADITISPVTSFNDNFIEGNETIKLIVLSALDEVIQVPNSRQTATITIIDDDSGELSIESSTYNVIENVGSVEICVVLTGGVMSITTEIELEAYSNTAKFDSDYSDDYLQLFLPRNTSRICGRIGIINDTIREDLYENFTLQIFRVQPVISTLTVNTNPSTVRIEDDDLAEVRFAIGHATFSEGGGNQTVTVILQNGQLADKKNVEVYIDDGTDIGISLGSVTFNTGSVPQSKTVTFPVTNNNIALEPDKHYMLRLRNLGNLGLGDPGTMNITVVDDDELQVTFQKQRPSITEGSNVIGVIERQTIANQAPFEVTVFFRRYTGPLLGDQGALGPREDDFDFTQEKSVVFERNSYQSSKSFSFFMPRDFIVELMEFFYWELHVNDSRVRTGIDRQVLGVNNVDVFSIGFKDLAITIREGETATLVVQQTNDHRGGTSIGGFPESRIEQIRLRESTGTSTEPGEYGADYSLNDTIPRFKYTNNTLADITFSPVTSLEDNFIEGNETIKLIILSELDEVIQVPNSRQTATITIIDDDSGELSLERSTYNVIENVGSVEICVVLTGGVLSENTEIELDIYQNTATFGSDYSDDYLQLELPRNTSRICGRIGIINDIIREDLYETFTVQIFQVQPVISTLTVNKNPSTVRIQDDDR